MNYLNMEKIKYIVLFLIGFVVIVCIGSIVEPNFSEAEETSEVVFVTYPEATVVPEGTTEVVTTEAPNPYAPFTYDDIYAMAQMVHGEAQTSPAYQKRLVCIVALNHYDHHCNEKYSLFDIVSDTSQFNAYSSSNPVTDEIWNICLEVLADYNNDYNNWESYYYFHSTGDGINNYFY